MREELIGKPLDVGPGVLAVTVRADQTIVAVIFKKICKCTFKRSSFSLINLMGYNRTSGFGGLFENISILWSAAVVNNDDLIITIGFNVADQLKHPKIRLISRDNDFQSFTFISEKDNIDSILFKIIFLKVSKEYG
jgi:hypothetical protein